jgi:hypothetical protein
MLKTIASVAAATVLTFAASAAQATPPAGDMTGASSPHVVLVAGGCGAGFHRGPGGGCRPNVGPGPGVVVPGPGPAAVPYWRGPGWRFYNGCWRGPAGRVHCG